MPRQLKDPTTFDLLSRLWKGYIKPYLPRLMVALAFMILGAFATAALAKLMEPVIDDVFKHENLSQLQWVVSVVFGIFILKGVSSYGEAVTMNYVGQSIVANLQKSLFSKLIQADVGFYYKNNTGSLVSLCTHNITLVRHMIENTLKSLGKDTFTILGLLAVMFYQDPFLSFIALFIFPLALFPLVRLSRKSRRVSRTAQSETGTWASFLTQSFQGIRLIKAYNMEAREEDYARSHTQKLLELALKAGRAKALSSPIMETIGGGAIVTVIAYGGYQVIIGASTAGAFFSFITALLMMYEPLKRVANLHANLQEGLAATAHIFEAMDAPQNITSPPAAPALHVREGSINLDNISFSYGKGQALKGVHVKIEAGEKMALVGPSGAGKSTLFNMILRFFDPDRGQISIDGQDIRRVDLYSLRQQIAFVSQEITLFNTSIAENILYGNPTASRAEVEQAAGRAAADDFIQALPHGYDSIVGEGGLTLSGGQRQRIALARAFLKDAPIILLDEATSALDTESEKKIQQALHVLMENKTALIIAHRLSTIQQVDRIMVLDHGEVVELGTMKELMAQKGLYATLSKQQFIDA